MKMKKSLLFILGFVLIIITSCEYKYIDPIDVQIDGPVSFSEQIEPFLIDKCGSCHASQSPILTLENSYNNLIDGNYIDTSDPESSAFYQKVNGGHPGGNNTLSPQELALILKWIQDGAENN